MPARLLRVIHFNAVFFPSNFQAGKSYMLREFSTRESKIEGLKVSYDIMPCRKENGQMKSCQTHKNGEAAEKVASEGGHFGRIVAAIGCANLNRSFMLL